MKKVIIKNLAGIQTHGAEMLDPSAWVADCVASNVWGKPERWVLASESHDSADVIAREMRVVVPAKTVLEQGPNGSVEKVVPPVEKEFVKLRAQYVVEIIDITYETKLAECLANRKLEYPTPEEFLDAFFDGDASTIAAIRAKRLAIKEKYKKPVR